MQSYRIALTIPIAIVAFTAGAFAQSTTTEQKETTTVELKGGKNVTLTGCLERSSGSGTPYMFTDDSGAKYALVSERDLGKFVDHRVTIKGRAADQGDAKVKIQHKVEGTSGEKSQQKVEASGDSTLLPYLGVKGVKSLKSACVSQ